MTRQSKLYDQACVMALVLAWVGIWMAWIPNRVAALNLHALYLAEWATFLPGVRYGDMRLVPEMLRLGVALAAVALAFSAVELDRRWLQWLIRIVAVIPPLVMLPPYPDVTRLWWSESYGIRFTMASVGLIGAAGSTAAILLPAHIRRGVVVALAATATGVAIWSYLPLQAAFEGYFAHTIRPGWGLILFIAGLTGVILIRAYSLMAGKWNSPEGAGQQT